MKKKLLSLLLAVSLILSAVACSSEPAVTSATTNATTTTTTTAKETTTTEAIVSEDTVKSEIVTETETATTSETTTAETTAAEAVTTADTTSAATTTAATVTSAASTQAEPDGEVRTSLSNPNASATTKKVYSYIMELMGNGIISGQQESTWMGGADYEMKYIFEATGKYPAIRGLDFMGDDFTGCVGRAKNWWKKGGLVSICWHCGADFSHSYTESQNTQLDWDKALTEGTEEYEAMLAGMDKAAAALLELQEEGVTVLWRPFHEFDGAWFWWGKGGAENFKALWKIMYNRYTEHWKLNNLIWVYGYSHKVSKDWYVGDEYVDVVGADCYDGGTQRTRYKRVMEYAMAGTPICYHENGEIPNPDQLDENDINWVWFMTWHTQHITSDEFNTKDSLNYIYNHDYVITLDELPDFTA